MPAENWEFWSKSDELTRLSSQLYRLPENVETRNNLVSLSNFLPLIRNLISLMKPKLFCEIGVDDGNSTHIWSELSQALEASYHAVDPTISPETISALPENVEIFKEKSLEYLKRKHSPDIYFIDGDHNHFTVLSELKNIETNRLSEQPVLVFMDDVGWPFARRDMYYNKVDIPVEDRVESSTGLNLSPTTKTHQEFGLPLDNLQVANIESTDKNGVLTAVEDFVASTPDWDFIKLPSLYGFGILWRVNELPTDCQLELNKISESFEFFYSFLGLLEFNRINLLSKINQLGKNHQKELRQITQEHGEIIREHGEIIREHAKTIDEILKDKSEADNYIQNLKDVIKKLEEERTVANDYIIELKQALNQLITDKQVADKEIVKLQQELDI